MIIHNVRQCGKTYTFMNLSKVASLTSKSLFEKIFEPEVLDDLYEDLERDLRSTKKETDDENEQ